MVYQDDRGCPPEETLCLGIVEAGAIAIAASAIFLQAALEKSPCGEFQKLAMEPGGNLKVSPGAHSIAGEFEKAAISLR